MLKGMKPVPKFKKGQTVYVFEMGPGVFQKDLGYSDKHIENMYDVTFEGGDIGPVRSSGTFIGEEGGRVSRVWQCKKAKVELVYHNYRVTLIYHGEPVTVVFSDRPDDKRIYNEGDSLPVDWEGYGIDFNMIVSKWLKRLTGSVIQLSDYYRDPVNRLLDNL